MSRRGSVSIQIGYHPMGIAVLAAPGVEAAGVPPAPQACGAVRPPAAVSVRYHVHTAHLPLGIALHQRELPESDMPRRPPRSPVHTHTQPDDSYRPRICWWADYGAIYTRAPLEQTEAKATERYFCLAAPRPESPESPFSVNHLPELHPLYHPRLYS